MIRGQTQHIFGFILITVVLVTTIYLSITLIGTLSDKTCQAEQASFARAINELGRTYDTIGTKQESEILAPCGAEYVCVFSQDAKATDVYSLPVNVGIQEHLAIATSLQDPKPNVIVFEGGAPRQELIQSKFVPDDKATCIRASGGRFSLYTEGHGRTISVSGLR